MKPDTSALVHYVQKAGLLFLSLLIFCFSLCAQYPNYSDLRGGVLSLDVPIEARDVAMGQSFCAVRNYIGAGMVNPAGITGLQGIHVLYANRQVRDDWGMNNFREFIAASFDISSIIIGLHYNRSNAFESDYLTCEMLPNMIDFDYTLGVIMAKEMDKNLSVGISIKTYNAGDHQASASMPILFDVGAIFSHSGFLNGGESIDQYTIGAALQNFGTDSRRKVTVMNSDNEDLLRLPRYLRVGFSYGVQILAPDSSVYNPVSLLFTGEYRNLLNAGGLSADEKDFWGFGIETKIFDLFIARLGGSILPYKSIFGNRGIPALTYGFGLNITLSRFGLGTPMVIKFDYAGLPQQNYFEDADISTRSLNLEISYPVNL